MTPAATTVVVTCDKCGICTRIASIDPAYVAGWLADAGWDDTGGLDTCPRCIQAAGTPLAALEQPSLFELTTETG